MLTRVSKYLCDARQAGKLVEATFAVRASRLILGLVFCFAPELRCRLRCVQELEKIGTCSEFMRSLLASVLTTLLVADTTERVCVPILRRDGPVRELL